MKSVAVIKWESVVAECHTHDKRLLKARQHIEKGLPFEPDDIEAMGDEECAWLDQFLYRFTKLQDTMGERLFLSGLLIIGEDFSHKPFIDMLNRLEALGLIPSRKWWEHQRELRNQIAHEYPDRRVEQCAAINAICHECEEITRVMDLIIETIEKRV